MSTYVIIIVVFCYFPSIVCPRDPLVFRNTDRFAFYSGFTGMNELRSFRHDCRSSVDKHFGFRTNLWKSEHACLAVVAALMFVVSDEGEVGRMSHRLRKNNHVVRYRKSGSQCDHIVERLTLSSRLTSSWMSNHSISGVGFPSTSHVKVTVDPKSAYTLLGLWRNWGPSEKNKKNNN